MPLPSPTIGIIRRRMPAAISASFAYRVPGPENPP
jgi:hypothetical protein